MRTFITYLSCAVLSVAFMSSCSTSFNIAKKRHSKGYYVDLGSDDHQYKSKARKVTSKQGNETEGVNGVATEELAVVNEATEGKLTKSGHTSNSLVEDAEVEKKAAELEDMSTFKKISTLKQMMKSQAEDEADVAFLILVLLAIILPPVAVYMKKGLDTHFWISILLTLLFWLPGVIHALLIVFDAI